MHHSINLLYVHGFGSEFDSNSDKVTTLSTVAQVYGLSVDWTTPMHSLDRLCEFAAGHSLDGIVGTSMGGWAASQLGHRLGLPFVAINPAIDPSQSLRKYLGKGVDHVGRSFELKESEISELPTLNEHGRGMILLDAGDEVIPSDITQSRYSAIYPVHMFPGGNHRFQHMAESLPLITTLITG